VVSCRLLWGLAGLVCVVAAAVSLASGQTAPGPEPSLTIEQQEAFLLHAEIIASHEVGTGVTHPWRLTLSDGKLQHDALFQSVDIYKQIFQPQSGPSEIGFRDSYRFNIAAYEIAKLIGMENMVPVTVERKWKGTTGSLSWWVRWKMMERKRLEEKIEPPNVLAWNDQMAMVRLFDELVYDTDVNLTNVLITEDWKIWRVDFSRAFRLYKKLKTPGNLDHCNRRVFAKLRQLTYQEVFARTRPYLYPAQVKALMARRDKIVAHFDDLVSQKGESAVFF
jgi:hypothetical protein